MEVHGSRELTGKSFKSPVGPIRIFVLEAFVAPLEHAPLDVRRAPAFDDRELVTIRQRVGGSRSRTFATFLPSDLSPPVSVV